MEIQTRRPARARRPLKTGIALCAILLATVVSQTGCGGNPVAPSAQPVRPPDVASVASVAPGKIAIISIDGLRPDALLAVGAPNILALADRGAYSWQAQTVMPSTTLPSHISMLSGFTPDVHGIVWDDYMKERGPIPVPTLFSVARSVGRRTAVMAGKHKFTYFCEGAGSDVCSISSNGDDEVTAGAVSSRAVDLLFVHLPDVDFTGHRTGWMSDAYLTAVRRADLAVGRIVSSLATDTTVILSADHGGHLYDHGSSQPSDTTIPWIIAGPRIAHGRQLSSAIRTVDTAATAAYVLGFPLQPGEAGRPVLEAFATPN